MAELWLGFRTLVRCGGVVAELWLGFSTLVRCGGLVAWF